MKQILQNLSTGHIEVIDVPSLQAKDGYFVIKTRTSLISAAMKRIFVNFGKVNLIEKARKQPEKVWQTLDKVKTDGFLTTIDAVRSKLDQPLPSDHWTQDPGTACGSAAAGKKRPK